jgi:Uma2 family endonuclease
MLDVPESLLDERRRLGLDVFDEVWEGVLHMVPPPSGEHQRLELEFGAALLAAAKRRGLVASTETGLFAADDDYRVPDIVVSLPVNCSHRGVDDTAELVVELRSPNDESYEKLPWYAARGITEMLIVDPVTRRFELYRNDRGTAVAVVPDDDGGVILDTLDVRLLTVASGDGPRLRVTTDAESTDAESTDC